MIRFTLTWPPSCLRPNSARRRHYHQNATAAALYKSVVAIELREQGVCKLPADIGPIALNLRFCPPDRKARDLDGSLSSAKAALDQLADMLGVDDSCFRPITLDVGPVVKGGAVEVTLHEPLG